MFALLRVGVFGWRRYRGGDLNLAAERVGESESTEQFDFIVVGAGSAGCVLAERLTRCGRYTVLLLEAGRHTRNVWTRIPLGYGKTFHDARVNWRYHTAPNPELRGREMYWPRGKGPGGSSAINGLVWMRGLPQDFDDWAASGNPGWDWSDVAPVFDEIEEVCDGHSPHSGRVSVADRSEDYHGIGKAYLAAAREIDLGEADRMESHWREGAAPYRITTRRGFRDSTSDVFLRPARQRKNLSVRTGILVDRIGFDGRRARTVEYLQNGQSRVAAARSSILLSAGAVGSPAILQRSGIGPAALLNGLGIEPRYANPAVGGGLQDHLGIDYLFRAKEPTLNQSLGRLSGQIRAGLQFLLRRRGPLTLSVNQMGGMVRSAEGIGHADLQLYFTPLSYSTRWRNKRPLMRPDPWPGFAFGFNTCRPTSRGRIDIADRMPETAPDIAPGYLTTPEDVESAIAGGRVIERMLNTSAMQGIIAGPNGFSPSGASDAEILADFRERASTVFHACGTCRMAPEAEGGVVDPMLNVYGVEGLRVVDASIFPNITSANTNAPTIMVAAKAAKLILEG